MPAICKRSSRTCASTADPIALHGFTQLPNLILRNPDLSTNAKTTYALLLSYAWHNNLCFPGQERLAERSIAELEQCGLIEIERRGQGKTNFYTVNVVRGKVRKSRFAPVGFWICRSAIHSI